MDKKRTSLIIIIFALVACLLYFIDVQKIRFWRTTNKPNILLVTVCSLRQDHLGCYGYPRHTSPNIDILASRSIIFKNFYTNVPWTKPSTIALMTGKYPAQAATVEQETALPTLLHSIGYKTYGIIGTDVVREGAKADVGFDIFLDSRDLKTSKDSHTVGADTIVSTAIELLNKSKINRQPVFIWLFFKDPHWQYLPPLEYKEEFLKDASLFSQESQDLVINEDGNNSIGGIGEARLRKADGEFIRNKAYYISQYDAEICFMDSQFGKIIEYLKREGDYEDWIIIFLSDHGESFGEDNYFFDHGYKLSEGTIKIPLIVKLPRQPRNIVATSPASICDIYPLVIKFAGFKKDMLKNNLYGRNILKNNAVWLNGHNPNRVIMLENKPTLEEENMKLIGCIWKSYKLIYNLTTNEKILYDISKNEVRLDSYDKNKQVIADKMSKFIESFFNKLDEADASDIEELKALGYLQ